MKKTILTSLLLFPTLFVWAQTSVPSQTVQSKVESAILYLDGAELTQKKTVSLNPGRNIVVFSAITPKLVSHFGTKAQIIPFNLLQWLDC